MSNTTSPPIAFRLPDMTCGSCVRRVREALEAAYGSIEHEIDLSQQRLTLARPSGVSQSDVAKTLEAAGYPAVAIERA